MKNLHINDMFVNRHNGTAANDVTEMLNAIGAKSVDELIENTVPNHIRLKEELPYFAPLSEYKFLEHLKQIASENKIAKSYIGLGYSPTILPAVIQRNILENPGWYTQYTPYQAEIAQGRLEVLINFQTMIVDLTGLPIANASLLDEGTAAAEAMLMVHANTKKKGANKIVVDKGVFKQTLDILYTRAIPKGVEVVVTDDVATELTDDVFALLLQFPNINGEVEDYKSLISTANSKDISVIVAADIMSLALFTPPGEMGAEIVVGSTQRFGVTMGFGGPHAAYFATSDKYKRVIPGRIIGATVDAQGNPAFRMALQTREQHIRREKATSNICTSQVLLAIMAAMYAIYHGPKGIKDIATRIHLLTVLMDKVLQKLGVQQLNKNYFDSLVIDLKSSEKVAELKIIAESKLINFNYYLGETKVGISFSEVNELEDVIELAELFSAVLGKQISSEQVLTLAKSVDVALPVELTRTSKYLQHPVFNTYHSESEFLRYVKKLESRDLSLTRSMIPLGSCTMKLNAAAEMLGVTYPEFANIHPFAPKSQVQGYMKLIDELSKRLLEVTGFDGISLQPNSGAQGEYTGLMVIRAYLNSNGGTDRTIALIPASAHGTNPASAVMAGFEIVVVACDEHGNIDINDLHAKIEANKEKLACLMVTYPSTHGVFEESIVDVCDKIHKAGGQVYMDGANMNAQVGLTSPATIGADVCHLNLHKTFAIPHGGGGPGMGPICVAKHLTPYLPNHVYTANNGKNTAVSAAHYGSAGILMISLGYILMLGSEGLKSATSVAILNANYIKAKLKEHYDVLYSGSNGMVAHELIFDVRNFKKTAGIEVEDIAKRLMDYGYHAPTVSFPVAGTLMVEPTESESKFELDRFIEALISIRKEIAAIEDGVADKADNLLKNAPHTMLMVTVEEWNHKYTREQAAFPTNFVKENKFWPYVTRVNNAFGDRNLVCSCNPITDYVK